MEKIVALCSGGFDSVCLLNYIRDLFPDSEIKTVFFNYGQKSYLQEREASKKVSAKLGCTFIEITLPKFHWTSGDFYSDGFSGDKEYLEMRNLVFISYGLSICESTNSSKLYMATLKSLGYYDTSEEFLSKVRGIASDKGISLETPFSGLSKYDLSSFAFKYSISEEDFFTCDNPVDGKPCGSCPDCLALKDIMEESKIDTPVKSWIKSFNPFDPNFQDLLRKSKVTEIRLLINNDCQLKCSHCYYGFESMKYPRLSLEEYKKLFIQAKELGISDFHFSGKEPLYDDFIFKVTDVLREVIPDADCTVVTNGINVPKYSLELKNHGFSKVFLSVDDIGDFSGVRSVHNVTDKALKSLKEVGIPVQVFIDLHENNFDKITFIIQYLHQVYGITEFYVRTISIIGSAKKNGISMLSNSQVNTTFLNLLGFLKVNKDLFVTFGMGAPYVYNILDDHNLTPNDYSLRVAINDVCDFANSYILDNFFLFPELYCGKYEDQITVTPDGFVHGCASEVSLKDYDLVSSGNVKESSLSDIIKKGKELCIQCNCNEMGSDGHLKFFDCTCCNYID